MPENKTHIASGSRAITGALLTPVRGHGASAIEAQGAGELTKVAGDFLQRSNATVLSNCPEEWGHERRDGCKRAPFRQPGQPRHRSSVGWVYPRNRLAGKI